VRGERGEGRGGDKGKGRQGEGEKGSKKMGRRGDMETWRHGEEEALEREGNGETHNCSTNALIYHGIRLYSLPAFAW
jgi:hypothetical protein